MIRRVEPVLQEESLPSRLLFSLPHYTHAYACLCYASMVARCGREVSILGSDPTRLKEQVRWDPDPREKTTRRESTMEELSAEELMVRYQETGDREYLGFASQILKDRMFRRIRLRRRASGYLDDAWREAWLEVASRRDNYKRGSPAYPYICRIVEKKLVDLVRAERRHRTVGGKVECIGVVDFEAIEEHIVDSSLSQVPANPVDVMVTEADVGRLRRLLERCRRTDREVCLAHYRGLSYRDISGSFDMPVGTVGTTIKQVRDSIRAMWNVSEVA